MIVLAVGLIAADRIMRDDVDRGLIRKFFLVLLAASMFPNHLRGYYGEVFTAVLVVLKLCRQSEPLVADSATPVAK